MIKNPDPHNNDGNNNDHNNNDNNNNHNDGNNVDDNLPSQPKTTKQALIFTAGQQCKLVACKARGETTSADYGPNGGSGRLYLQPAVNRQPDYRQENS